MQPAGMSGLTVQGRTQTYTLVIGVVVGLLVAGLGIPFLFGTPLGEVASPEIGDERGQGADGLAASGPEGDADPVDDGGSDPGDAAAQAQQPPVGETEAEGDATGPDAGGDDGMAEPEVADPENGENAEMSDGNGADDAAGAADAQLTASDRGVTSDSIQVGMLLLDVAALGDIGVGVPGVDPEAQEEAWRAYVDDLNEAGGINGRTVEPTFESYDPLSQDSMRAACLAITQDREVFAVFDSGGLVGGAVTCITEENETPLLTSGSQGVTSEMMSRSQGRLFAIMDRSERVAANAAHELEQLGTLEGRTIGVTVAEQDRSVAQKFEDRLAEHGKEVAYVAEFSNDIETGTSQVPIEVQQMRTNGVDAVIHLVSVVYGTQFVQTADSQGYTPQYVTTNWRNANVDVYGDAMPNSYDGTVALTSQRTNEGRAGLPEAERGQECRQIYEERTGQSLERDSNDYGLYLIFCDTLDIFARGAGAVGAELTRDGLGEGMRSIGEFPMGAYVGGSFEEGKHDASNFVRTMRWESDCRCHMPQDDWRETRF